MKRSVVQVTPRYLPSLGGVERHVSELTKELVIRGYTNTIVTIQHDPMLPQYEEKNGLVIYRIPLRVFNKKLQTWFWILTHWRIFNATVVQVHDVGWWLVPILPLLFKNFYMTFHGWEGQYPVPLKNKLQRYLFAQFAKKTIHVGDFIKEFYWDRPNLVTYGGVTLKSKLPKLQPIKKLRFVFLGRLEKENAIEKYLQFLELLKKNKVDFSIIWVGAGSFTKVCRTFGKVTGMVDSPETYIATADFVLANSYLSILEAHAQGKIVCSLYNNMLKKRYLETYPAAQQLLIANDAYELFEKWQSLLKDKKREARSSREAYLFAKNQTWEKLVSAYEDLWFGSI